MTSDQARQRAEKNFSREQRARDGQKAMTEYEAQAGAIREKTARLKALRLAKEAKDAQAQTEALTETSTAASSATQTIKRSRTPRKVPAL